MMFKRHGGHDDAKEPENAVMIKALQDQGYTVLPPPCPDCRGIGFIATSWTGESYLGPDGRTHSSGGVGSKPCPRGCRLQAWM